ESSAARASRASSAPGASDSRVTSVPWTTPSDSTPSMLCAGTDFSPTRIRTGTPSRAASWTNSLAGRACSPLADATATVLSGMAISSRFDGDLDGLAPADQVDPVEHPRQREPVGDQVGHRHRALGDQAQGPRVV